MRGGLIKRAFELGYRCAVSNARIHGVSLKTAADAGAALVSSAPSVPTRARSINRAAIGVGAGGALSAAILGTVAYNQYRKRKDLQNRQAGMDHILNKLRGMYSR